MTKGRGANNRDAIGCAKVLIGTLVVVVVLVAAPKSIRLGVGAVVAAVVLIGAFCVGVSIYQDRRSLRAKRERGQQAPPSATEEKKQERRMRRAMQRRIKTLGAKNAELTESALAAVKQVVESEAAKAGWLGDVDFTADVGSITENFSKVHALRKVALELSELDDPSDEDRKLLADAEATAADLEVAAVQRWN